MMTREDIKELQHALEDVLGESQEESLRSLILYVEGVLDYIDERVK